jgi:chromatin segregation and condensation protein Rec8/ScpA/Scc1 (kleisin family)
MNFRGGSVFVPDARISVTTLQSIALLTVASFKPPERLMKIAVEQVLRIETVIENLITRVQNIGGLTLSTLATGVETFEQKKKLLIVNFIALLELVRSGALVANQSESGGDIHIQVASQQA